MTTSMAVSDDAVADGDNLNILNTNSLRVSPFYFSAVNALTQPNQVVFCSRYFVRRWMPLLGGTGTQIVLYLRSLGFYNRQTGELRDEIAVGVRDIAAACACSVATVRREFASNEVLQMFVQIRQRWEPDPVSGQTRQCENGYRVAMDDPPHDEDRAWIEAYIAEEEGGAVPLVPISNQPVSATKPAGTIPLNQIARGGVSNCEGGGNQIATHPQSNCESSKKDTKTKRLSPKTLNVGGVVKTTSLPDQTEQSPEKSGDLSSRVGDVSSSEVQPSKTAIRSAYSQALENEAHALAKELNDVDSLARHRQLLGICSKHGLDNLPMIALGAVRKRQQGGGDPLDRPGAYYQRILIGLLEEHQVFVPKAGEEDATEVRQIILASMN